MTTHTLCGVCRQKLAYPGEPHFHQPDPDPLYVPEQPVRRVESDSRAPILYLTAAFLVLIGVIGILVVSCFMPRDAHAAGGQVGGSGDDQAQRGVATYFATCQFCAAASGELQDALGHDWQGRFVTVSRGGRHVTLRLVTGCGCGPRAGGPTVIDLSEQAFYRLLAPAERPKAKTHAEAIADVGVQPVVVSWESGPAATLPPTNVVEPESGTVGLEEGPGERYAWLAVIAVIFAPALHLIRIRRARG